MIIYMRSTLESLSFHLKYVLLDYYIYGISLSWHSIDIKDKYHGKARSFAPYSVKESDEHYVRILCPVFPDIEDLF